jgi:hypothetical protein
VTRPPSATAIASPALLPALLMSCFDVLIDEAIAMFRSRYGVNNDG